jgi:ABC-type dipeptide/oligopeptide/nickel transport system permease component
VISALFEIPGISSALGETMYGATFPGVATPFGTTGNAPVIFFLFAVITMVFNLIVDLSYRFLDPRATLTI